MITKDKVTDRIFLPDAPQVPGLLFRGFRGEADYPNILRAINGSKKVDGVERADTLEDIVRNYTFLYHCDPYQDMIFAEVDGEVVGYSRVEWNLTEAGELLGFQIAFLLPEWRRKGIGRAMLRFTERRLREIADRLIAEGQVPADAPRFYEGWVTDTEVGKAALFEKEGYTPVRYTFSMVRSLEEPVEVTPMPEGLEVRPVPPEHYRAVWDADQEAFRDHWGYFPAPEEEYQKWLKSGEFQPDLWKVAWDGDQVAGMVLNHVNELENVEYDRKRGYTEGISVRQPWRKRGLARALLTRSLQMFKDMGMSEAALGVDAENPNGALRLYESVGFKVYQRHTTYRKAF